MARGGGRGGAATRGSDVHVVDRVREHRVELPLLPPRQKTTLERAVAATAATAAARGGAAAWRAATPELATVQRRAGLRQHLPNEGRGKG